MVDFDWTLLPSITKYLATGDWEIRISELEKKTKFNFDRVFADAGFLTCKNGNFYFPAH